MPVFCCILSIKYEHMFVFLWQTGCKKASAYAIMVLAARGKAPCGRTKCRKNFRAESRGVLRAAESGLRRFGRRARPRAAENSVSGRRAKGMKDYQKVLLYAYPKLGRMAEDIGQIVQAKARASVMGREPALSCAEKLIGYNFLREQLLFVQGELDGVLAKLTREERFLLEYKYFRRKRELAAYADLRLSCSERTYFRRQQRLARTVNAEFVRRGLTEEWFFEAFSGVSFFMSALESVRRAEGGMVDKRTRAGIPCGGRPRGDQSGCS